MDRFNYLYLAAMSLPSETEAQKVLKSMYMTKSKELFGYDRKSRDLKFNPTRTCRRCNSLWADGGCRITLKERPKGKCKSQRKCRQLVRKHYKYGMQSGRFTRMANFFARKMCRQVVSSRNKRDTVSWLYQSITDLPLHSVWLQADLLLETEIKDTHGKEIKIRNCWWPWFHCRREEAKEEETQVVCWPGQESHDLFATTQRDSQIEQGWQA